MTELVGPKEIVVRIPIHGPPAVQLDIIMHALTLLRGFQQDAEAELKESKGPRFLPEDRVFFQQAPGLVCQATVLSSCYGTDGYYYQLQYDSKLSGASFHTMRADRDIWPVFSRVKQADRREAMSRKAHRPTRARASKRSAELEEIMSGGMGL